MCTSTTTGSTGARASRASSSACSGACTGGKNAPWTGHTREANQPLSPPHPAGRILLRYDVPTTLEVSLVSRRLVPDLSRVVRASRRLPIDGLDHPNVRAPDVLLNVWPWA